jgi:AraC-like DNA-binding protein
MSRVLQALLGPNWRPTKVCFKQQRPQQTEAFTGFFHCPVAFGAPFNGLLCRAADLAQPPQTPQPQLAAFARHVLDGAMQQEPYSTAAVVRQLVTVLLPSGRCTAQLVAQHLGVDRRTLHRHLSHDGTRFSVVLQQVRLDMAHHQLRHSQRPLAEVAALLGFRAPSAFSDWFRHSAGCTARAYRQDGYRP